MLANFSTITHAIHQYYDNYRYYYWLLSIKWIFVHCIGTPLAFGPVTKYECTEANKKKRTILFVIIIGNSKTNTNNINNTRNINNNGQYFIRCELLQAYCERASVRAHIPLSIFGLIERCDHSPKNYVVAGDSQVALNMATYYTHIYYYYWVYYYVSLNQWMVCVHSWMHDSVKGFEVWINICYLCGRGQSGRRNYSILFSQEAILRWSKKLIIKCDHFLSLPIVAVPVYALIKIVKLRMPSHAHGRNWPPIGVAEGQSLN